MLVSPLVAAESLSKTRRTWGRTAAGAAALLLALVVVRSPGLIFGVLNIDETDLLLIARKLLAGHILYVDAVEIKPPLAFLAYLPGALAGFRMWPMQLVGIGWAFATLWILKRAAEIWTGRSAVGWAAAWLGLLASCCDVPAVNTELLLNLPAASALFFFVRGEKDRKSKHWLLAGLCCGIASLFKHQAGILLIALVASQLWPRTRSGDADGSPSPPTAARVGWMVLGFALPWATAASVYAALGQLGAFYEWNIGRNLGYVRMSGTDHALVRFIRTTLICVAAGTPVPWLLAIRGGRRQPDRIRLGLALVLGLTWIPVCLGGRFYEHYFLQFAPPLALLGAPALVELLERWQQLRLWFRWAAVVATVLPPLGLLAVGIGRGLAQDYPAQDAKVVELTHWLEGHSRRADTLFVWGHFSPIYYLAGREPGTRYLTTSVHMGNFDPHHLPPNFDAAAHRSELDIDRTLQDLEANKPAWVVDTAPADIHDWSRIPLSKFPQLERYIAAHYALVAEPGGAAVYRRRDASKLTDLSSAGLGN